MAHTYTRIVRFSGKGTESPRGGVYVQARRGAHEPRRWRLDARPLTTAAFARDGNLLATSHGGGAIRVWNLRTGRTVAEFTRNTDSAVSLGFDPGNTLLAVGRTTGDLELLRLDGSARTVLTGHGGAVFGVAFSPTGSRLASAGGDGTVRIWDPERAIELLVLRGHRAYVKCVAWSADGHRLYAGGGGATLRTCTVRVWEAASR